jgi:deoxyribose-phosphate aldolase
VTSDLARFIQHTLIAAGVTRARLEQHIAECVEYGFNAAMVGAAWLPEARALLAGTQVRAASAVDFPYGCMTTAGRVAEMRALVDAGADEVDIGVQIGWLRSGDVQRFTDDLDGVVAAAGGVPVKVMLELPLLSAPEREIAVASAVSVGVSFVKNASSGAVGVATAEDIGWLRARVPATVGVKASGGIKSAAQVRALLAAGADLVGTSSAVQIVTGAEARASSSY